MRQQWVTPPQAARLWRAMAWCHAVLAIEVVFGLRYAAHDWVNSVLQQGGMYAQRAELQRVLITAAAALSVAGIALIWALRTCGAALQLALAASFCAWMFFALESVSLHAIDALLYRAVGPLRWIGLVWLCLAAVAAAAALRYRLTAAAAA